MSVNWKLMIQLRERQKMEAGDLVAKERQVVAESEVQVQSAQGRLNQELAAKTALWQQTRSSFDGGAVNVEQLRFATSYSKVLDARAAEAAKAVHDAQSEMQKKLVVLDERRQQLREAMGDLEKAKEMQLRHLKQLNQAAEYRMEDALDEWSTSKWTAQASAHTH